MAALVWLAEMGGQQRLGRLMAGMQLAVWLVPTVAGGLRSAATLPIPLQVYACPMNWSSAAVVATEASLMEMEQKKCQFVHFMGSVISNASTPKPPGDVIPLLRFEHPNGDRLTVASMPSTAYARANGYQFVRQEGWIYATREAAGGDEALPLILYESESRWSNGANVSVHWLVAGSQAAIQNGPVAMAGAGGWHSVRIEGYVGLTWSRWWQSGA
eukprot:COSAG03_NODE_4490_length_1534_cov_2.217422_2_plen_215_part_00